MKVVVRLAVIVAALLMVSNVAFAVAPTDCTGDQVVCYNVILTYIDSSPGNLTYKFCLNDDGTGNLCTIGDGCAQYLKVFGGGTGWFNFDGAPQYGGNPNWSLWIANGIGFSGMYQPIGEGYLLSGVETTYAGRGDIVNGTKVKCPNPPSP
jgi:hypothetical protein